MDFVKSVTFKYLVKAEASLEVQFKPEITDEPMTIREKEACTNKVVTFLSEIE